MRVRASAIGALAVAALTVPAGAQESVNVRRTVSATGTMEVQVTSGQVRLVGWGRNELQVTGTLGSESERLDVSTDGANVVVRVVNPRGRNHGSSSGTELEIHFPARRGLQLQTVSADVAVESASGAVHTTTVSGNVEVQGNPTELEVNTRSGDIQLHGNTGRLQSNSISGNVQVNGSVRGEAQVATVSGDIQLTGPVGNLSAHSVSGNIEATSVANSAEAQTVSGDIQITARTLTGEYSTVSGGIHLSGRPGPGRTLEVHSHSGEVELRLPRGVNADAEITTWSGEIEIDYDGARVQQSSRRERVVRINGGGPRVELSTFSGTVRIVQQ
jgi:DUF4097 and DUF4098 domain-containing protein YvlB